MAALNRENEKEATPFKEHCTTILNRLTTLQTNLTKKVSIRNPNYDQQMSLETIYKTLDPEDCKHSNINIYFQWSILFNHCTEIMQEFNEHLKTLTAAVLTRKAAKKHRKSYYSFLCATTVYHRLIQFIITINKLIFYKIIPFTEELAKSQKYNITIFVNHLNFIMGSIKAKISGKMWKHASFITWICFSPQISIVQDFSEKECEKFWVDASGFIKALTKEHTEWNISSWRSGGTNTNDKVIEIPRV